MLDICVSCVPNRVRDLKTILLDMCVFYACRTLRQLYLSYGFSECAEQSGRLEDKLTSHVCFLCVSNIEAILQDTINFGYSEV